MSLVIFFQLHLVFHACVQKFDVIGIVENFLGTKQGLSPTHTLASISGSLNWQVLRSKKTRIHTLLLMGMSPPTKDTTSLALKINLVKYEYLFESTRWTGCSTIKEPRHLVRLCSEVKFIFQFYQFYFCMFFEFMSCLYHNFFITFRKKLFWYAYEEFVICLWEASFFSTKEDSG